MLYIYIYIYIYIYTYNIKHIYSLTCSNGHLHNTPIHLTTNSESHQANSSHTIVTVYDDHLSNETMRSATTSLLLYLLYCY